MVLIFIFSIFLYVTLNASSTLLKIKVVREKNGEAVKGVGCAIKKIGKKKFLTGKTNSKGELVFKNISTGKYELNFSSMSLKGKYKDWALPDEVGPVTIKEGRNKYKISTQQSASVKGKIDYEGNFDLGQSYIKSSRSQFDVHPNANGEFRLHGVFSKKPIRLRIDVLPPLPSKVHDVPLYTRIVNIRESKIIPGSVIDVGSINVPRPGEKEFVRIHILDAKEEKRLTGKRLNQLSMELRIKSQNKKILLNGSSWLLRRKVRRGGDKGAKFRLPSGVYTVWWHGYKEQTKKEFRITRDQPPKIDMRLPEK